MKPYLPVKVVSDIFVNAGPLDQCSGLELTLDNTYVFSA